MEPEAKEPRLTGGGRKGTLDPELVSEDSEAFRKGVDRNPRRVIWGSPVLAISSERGEFLANG